MREGSGASPLVLPCFRNARTPVWRVSLLILLAPSWYRTARLHPLALGFHLTLPAEGGILRATVEFRPRRARCANPCRSVSAPPSNLPLQLALVTPSWKLGMLRALQGEYYRLANGALLHCPSPMVLPVLLTNGLNRGILVSEVL